MGLLRCFAIQYDLMGFVVRHTVDGVPEDGPPSLSLTALQWTHFQGEKAQPWERDFLARGHSSAGAFASEVAPSVAPSPIVIEQPPGVSPSVSPMPEEQGSSCLDEGRPGRVGIPLLRVMGTGTQMDSSKKRI